ncbi:MAG TPA: hypothetical protein VHF22_00445 [Planctomycetota bacterium]|nr:hypothetical protein [Planctomycetota bacterium]
MDAERHCRRRVENLESLRRRVPARKPTGLSPDARELFDAAITGSGMPGRVIVADIDQGKVLMVGARGWGQIDPEWTERYLNELEELVAAGLMRQDKPDLYLFTAAGWKRAKANG